MTRPTARLTLLAAALAASAASWASYQSTLIPAPAAPAEALATPLTTTRVPPADVEATLDANETVVTVEAPPAGPSIAAPPQSAIVPAAQPREPAIEVTRPRLTPDQRIQADVIDLLARNPDISGKIGVVAENAVVTLTGYTATSGQAHRAARAARGVDGVREVSNHIRPRVGGSA